MRRDPTPRFQSAVCFDSEQGAHFDMIKPSEAFGRRVLARSRRSGPFNVGLLIPTSGAMGLLGPCAYACARLARDLWNRQGGVDGREVRLTVLNSSESARMLDDELRDALDTGEVDALVVLSNTEVCRRIAPVVNARVPLIYTPMFEGTGLPDWVHAIGETPERQLLPAIDWMSTRFHPRRWYMLGNDYSWPRRSHALAIPSVKATGAEVVRERYVPLGERDYGDVVEDIAASRAEVVLLSLLTGDAVHFCREFERAGLGGKVLRLSICVEENAVLGVGHDSSEGMFVAAGYFAAIESDVNGSFKERYRNQFGERAPTLNSASQSVYEGFVHLHRQVFAGRGRRGTPGLPGVRDAHHRAYDAGRNPIYLGEVRGLAIQPVQRLTGEPG
jgi:ABC-type branched-subunit amino acid transport system substrate-binding protein